MVHLKMSVETSSPISEAGDEEKFVEEKTSGHGKQLREQSDEEPTINNKTPQQSVSTVIDWDSDDDPENPYNWSTARRMFQTVSIALLCLSTTFGASIYAPGSAQLAHEFGVSEVAAVLGLSLYTLAQGFGPALAAPISETYGRLIVYRVSMPLSMFFTLGAGFSQTFAQFLVCRFFAGLIGSPVIAVGGGSIADLWAMEDRAIATSLFLIAPFAGPALGPSVGGFTVMGKGWRWTQWDILFLCLPVYCLCFALDETYKKIILKRRAKKRGIHIPNDGPRGWKRAEAFLVMTLARPLRMMLTEPIVSSFCLYVAFMFAIIFGFIAAFPIIFGDIYHFNLGESGLTFLAIGLGLVLGGVTVFLCDVYIYKKRWRQAVAESKTNLPPEERLYAAMIGSIGLPIGLFWFAWTARADIHWISPTLAGLPIAWANMCISVTCILYTVDCYGPLLGASALAANSVARYTAAAGFPLFINAMYSKLGVQWATSLFGFLSIFMLPIPWVLFKWGPQVRARSSYETTKFDT